MHACLAHCLPAGTVLHRVLYFHMLTTYSHSFLQLELVCREIKSSKLLFGGIQLIFVLDACQLPPVPDKAIGDEGRFCFESPLWAELFRHKVHLTNNHRTDDGDLCKLIDQCLKGDVSEDMCRFANSLSRPLNQDQDATHLFGTNFECLLHNSEKLKLIEGPSVTYTSTDEGRMSDLDTNRVPHKITLKVGDML